LRWAEISGPVDGAALPWLGPALAEGPARRMARTKKIAVLLLVVGASVQCVSLATSFMEDQVPRGHYYDANWDYRLSYSLSGQIHLLWKYAHSSEPARLDWVGIAGSCFCTKGSLRRDARYSGLIMIVDWESA